jgi:hypothetical protein
MSVAFNRGQQLGREDLNIFIENANGLPMNPAEITYALYDFTTGQEVLVGPPRRLPANPSVGEFYANIVVPLDANMGAYRIRWTFRETVNGPIQQAVQEFAVVDRGVEPILPYTEQTVDLVRRLRILLRDNKPDRNYHFRPPAHEETIRQFNRVFGFLWEDEELVEYLERGLDMVIAAPPRTPFQDIDQLYLYKPEWKTLLLTGAMWFALNALRLNWIVDEFDYSIGGVSLSIDKASKYEAAASSASDQFDKMLENAKATVKVTRGLQQPKYGTGIRSAFGPYTGRGVLTPAKFIGF